MLKGIAVSQGIGLGRVMLLEEQGLPLTASGGREPVAERQRFRQAVEAFCQSTASQVEQLRRSAGDEDAFILESHIQMARDPILLEEVEALIGEGACAGQALEQVCQRYIEIFSSSHDELTRLRAADIRDMRSSLRCLLAGAQEVSLRNVPKGTVLVTKELSPSVMSGIDGENVVGIVTETGGMSSHSSILARALGIPTVCGVQGAVALLKAGCFVIVDGSRGEVLCSPAQRVIEDYYHRREEFLSHRSQVKKYKNRETRAASGEVFSLTGNISLPSGAAGAVAAGAEGVGLFRTEYLFMNRAVPPDEAEQTAAYTLALEGAGGRPVTIRTLDAGGDKDVPCLDLPKEENPFLGQRGIRWCLAHRELFLIQLRALLRAGVGRALRVMFPMVSTLEELRQAKALLGEAAAQLKAQGIAVEKPLPVGVMIETPAAAWTAESLAQEADFFSIGTNDLSSYIMACDRSNAQVAGMCSPLQPGVLRCLGHVIASARGAGIPVTICGEAAADPRMIPLLMAFGITGFSVSPGAVLQVRKIISDWSLADAQALASQVLAAGTLPETAALSGA